MSDSMLSYCGLNCGECHAYLAYKTDDEELRAEVAKKWSSPEYLVTPADINCAGCKSEEGPHFKWCAECSLRACGHEHNVETCAHCDEFVCEKVKQAGEENLKRLENIRASLA